MEGFSEANTHLNAGEQSQLSETWSKLWQGQPSDEQALKKEIKRHQVERKFFIKLLAKCVADTPVKNPQVLEIACGTAIDSFLLASTTPQAQILATDLLPESIDYAKNILKINSLNNLQFGVADGTKLEQLGKKFDIIFSQGLLEHFQDPSPFMESQTHALNDDGLLVINVPQKYNPYTFYKHRKIKKNAWEYGWETEYSFAQLKKLGEKFNLRPIAWCGSGYDPRRDYGLGILRLGIQRLQEKNPWRAKFPFKQIEILYDKLWEIPERKFGHYFMQSITVAFRKS